SILCPEPSVRAWSRPCVTSCGDSRATIHPPAVLVTFPGPVLSSCPQESVVGPAGNCLGSSRNFLGTSGNCLGT
ncbi:KRSC protein, partial [Alaudala cheleensis]|nr:KRSC protein [Alaudala cheleensis]